MISFTAVCRIVPGLTEAELAQWLEADFIRPAQGGDEAMFSDADIARVRLIRDLRALLEVEEQTLPLVLSLLDQLYATRWQLRRLMTQQGKAE